MKGSAMITGLCLMLANPGWAGGYKAENRVTVSPGAGSFSISDGAGYGARDMWCAAADYARNRLGAGGTTRIYIVGARDALRAPVTFSLSPGDLTPKAVRIVGASLRTAGANLSVDHALSFCADARIINR